MGSPISQVAPSTQPQGKGFASPPQQDAPNIATLEGQPQTRQGKGGSVTLPGQGGQPKLGQPNMYPNTVGQWDNASIQPQQSRNRGGKGKG
jgi:hypothetical protein